MSKKLFLILLAANFIVFSWEVGPGRKSPIPNREEVEVDRLVLLTELADPPKKRPTQPGVATPDMESESAAGGGPKTSEAEWSQEESAQVAHSRSSLEFLPQTVATETGSQEISVSCYLIGPFSRENDAKNFLARFRESGMGGKIESVVLQASPGYWLMIPPLSSREEAQAMLEHLESQGIEDVWLFDKGPRKGAISLGMYSTKSRAEKVAAKYRLQGVDVKVMPKNDSHKEFWIRFENASPLDLKALQAPELQQRLCHHQSEKEETTSPEEPLGGTGALERE